MKERTGHLTLFFILLIKLFNFVYIIWSPFYSVIRNIILETSEHQAELCGLGGRDLDMFLRAARSLPGLPYNNYSSKLHLPIFNFLRDAAAHFYRMSRQIVIIIYFIC